MFKKNPSTKQRDREEGIIDLTEEREEKKQKIANPVDIANSLYEFQRNYKEGDSFGTPDAKFLESWQVILLAEAPTNLTSESQLIKSLACLFMTSFPNQQTRNTILSHCENKGTRATFKNLLFAATNQIKLPRTEEKPETTSSNDVNSFYERYMKLINAGNYQTCLKEIDDLFNRTDNNVFSRFETWQTIFLPISFQVPGLSNYLTSLQKKFTEHFPERTADTLQEIINTIKNASLNKQQCLGEVLQKHLSTPNRIQQLQSLSITNDFSKNPSPNGASVRFSNILRPL